jgi:MoaA/NifB/PqqE/SkfB family radical SAM enzyme
VESLRAKAGRVGRQLWARRAEFGSPLFWLKAARTGARVGQAAFWPEPVLERTIAVFEQRPWNLHIETTNACNADCVFCAYQYMERPKRVMAMSVYEKALADYVAIGGGDLMLEVVVGDPILDPTFLEKIHKARAHREIARIETITNGIGIDRIGAEALVDSGISKIFISTSGFEAKSYEELYRSHKYDLMRSNVLDLLRANERRGRPVDVTIGFRTNRSLEDVLSDPDFQEIRAFGPSIDFTYSFSNWGGKIDFDDLPAGFVRREPPKHTEPCVWLYDGPIVFVNGDVGLCGCQDVEARSDLVVGNILERSLQEIWTTPRVAELRRNFTTDKPDICRDCTVYRNLDALRSWEGVQRARTTRGRLRASRCQPATDQRRHLPLAR